MANLGTEHFSQRLRRLSSLVNNSGADVALITPGADLAYLVGHSVASHERLTCLIVPADGPAMLLLPTLERLGWSGTSVEAMELPIHTWTDGADPYATLISLLPTTPSLIAVGDYMPAFHALKLKTAAEGSELMLAGPLVAELRMRKDEPEIAALAEAGSAIDRVQRRIGEWLIAGRTENAIAADIAAAIVEEGHERPDFVIVGSGPNGASPHHEASDRVVQPGDAVVIDIGGPTAAGYFSDCTRTYQVAGEPDADFNVVYEIVRQAQRAGVAAATVGATAESVDSASRAVIEKAGYGEFFITRTGHGIGLEVHEEPYMVAGNTRELEVGMVFSVEPGIYLPGRFGVRIEDIVVVTPDGPALMNNCPTELIVLGG